MGKPGTRSDSPGTRSNQKGKKDGVANTAGNEASNESAGGSSVDVPNWATMKHEIKGMIDDMLVKFKNDITETMNSRFDQLEAQFNGSYEEIKADISNMKDDMKEMKGDITEVQMKVSDIEDGMNEHTRTLDEIEERYKKDMKELREEFDEKLAKAKGEADKQHRLLERQNLLLERHDRKYSLLLYGVPQERNENIYDVIKRMFEHDLQIRKQRVDDMYFANAHRLYSTAAGPKPIIVKFLSFDDRELVYSMASKLRGTRMRILTDLPVVMKNERHRLSKVAYDIRQNESVPTRIKDKDLDVWLEVKEGGQWVKRDV